MRDDGWQIRRRDEDIITLPIFWVINPRPIFCAFAQTFAHGIHQHVTHLLSFFVMIVQTMIEEVALPGNSLCASEVSLPVCHRRPDSRLTRKRDDGVEMVGHEKSNATMPHATLVIIGERPEHRIAHPCATKMIHATRLAVDGDEEERPFRNPLWHSMRQALANRAFHVNEAVQSAFVCPSQGRAAMSSSRRAAHWGI